MFDWLKGRFSEPSSYGGLAALMYGAGEIFKINEAPAVVGAIGAAGEAAAGGNWLGGLVALLGGVALAVGEKSDGR